ncbi:MAG TPA: rhomboid family intramembrane serine protease [Bacteroides sp.]|nr:rhomboid family intramembrane serine protease [Bacteroides sp.]
MEEKRKFYHSLVFPAFFLLVIWTIKVTEFALDLSFSHLGLFPLKAEGLKGIFFSPLIHSDFKHLFDNSIPLFFLSVAIFYFYRPVAYRVFFLIWFVGGLIVWLTARPAYHIGASGLVYGFASFVFFSGIIRRNINLLAISLLVVFLYGGLVWGVFPYDFRISWESHLVGGLAGLGMAFYFRSYGPPSTRKIWEEEEDEEENGLSPDQESESPSDADYPGDTDPVI